MELLPSQRAEIAALSRRFGEPLRIDATIHDGFFDPIRRPDRAGEVCMVLRRPSGKLLLSIKTFYPRGAYRLPTGGVDHGEPILDALLRETAEETGLGVEVRRFLAQIAYRPVSAPDGEPIFLLSAPRSGSTFLFDLLSRFDRLWAWHAEVDEIWWRHFPYERSAELSDHVGAEEMALVADDGNGQED